MKYSAAFAWENKLLNGLQMKPVFLSLLRMTYLFVIAKPCKRLWQSVSPLRGLRILSRFAFRMTRFFSHCEGAGVRWTPLRSRSTDRAGRRDVNGCGNPFSPFIRNSGLFSLSTLFYKSNPMISALAVSIFFCVFVFIVC